MAEYPILPGHPKKREFISIERLESWVLPAKQSQRQRAKQSKSS